MKFTTQTLSNGVKIVYEYAKNTAVAHAAFVLNVGSRDEHPSQMGMAHFIEHCMFKGTATKNAQQIIEASEGLGGELNAYTTKEDTSIYASFTKENWKSQVELLVQVLFGSTFPEAELEKEKKVIYDEMNYYLDSPSDLITEEFDELLFPKHPLGTPILGTPKSLKSIKRDQVISFVEQHYKSPKNIVFAFSGDVPLSKLRAFLEKQFKAYPLLSSPQKRLKPEPKPMFNLVKQKEGHQTHLLMGTYAYPYTHKRNWELALLNHYFGGNALNSRLNVVLREEHGLTYQVESSYQPFADTGIFTIYLSTETKHLVKVKKLIQAECERMQKGLSKAELERLKQQFCTQFLLARENRLSNILAMGKALLTVHKVHTDKAIIQKIKSIKRSTVNKMAQELFQYQNFSTLVYQSK